MRWWCKNQPFSDQVNALAAKAECNFMSTEVMLAQEVFVMVKDLCPWANAWKQHQKHPHNIESIHYSSILA